MYDALELGTPQIVLSDLYMGLVAAFQCKVDWDRLVYKVPEQELKEAPLETMTKVMNDIMNGNGKDPLGRLRRMWEATREYKDDLLWSSENSRVGHNLLEEIGRRCTTGSRQAIWDKYTKLASR